MPRRESRLVYPRRLPRRWKTYAVQRVCWYALREVIGQNPTVSILEDRLNTIEAKRGASIDINATVGDSDFEFFWLWQSFNQLAAYTGVVLEDFDQRYDATHAVQVVSLPRQVQDRVQKIVDVVVDLAAPISAAADAARRAYNAVHRIADFVVPDIVAKFDAWAAAKAENAKASIVDPLKDRFNRALEVIVRESTVEMRKAQETVDKPVQLRTSDEIIKRLSAPIEFLRSLVNAKSK